MVRVVLAVSWWLVAVVGFAGCGIGGVSLPDELEGSWGDTCCGGCIRTFTFTSNEVVFSESCPATGSGGYDAEVAEVFEEEGIFKTTNGMYFTWHVEGSTLYLNKTNPGATKPVVSDGWWSAAEYVLTRK